MLNIYQKINHFENILSHKNNSYADKIREDLYDYFFIALGTKDDIENFTFLNICSNYKEIENKAEFIISKIIMHEHHADIEYLINEYIN